ncbi:MAG: porin [Candidatus Kapaibacterium sp.]
MKRLSMLILSVFAISSLFTSAIAQMPDLKVSAYVDSYYATDNDNGRMGSRLFSYVNNTKDEFGLNIGQISVSADTEHYYGKVTFHTGDLAGSAIPGMIQEAYAGFKFTDKFTVDAGYFLTHIGGEALLPKDNWLSSHSLVTFYEPFYHAGVRFGYQFSQNFGAQLHILNGNGIFRDNNMNKTLGWYLAYNNDNETFTLSYAGLLGNEAPGSPNNAQTHMYHNVCAGLKLSDNFETKAQFDFASLEDGTRDDDGELTAGSFMGASLQGRYHFSKMANATLRVAYIDDSDAIYGEDWKHFTGLGVTLGAEYKPVENGYIRLEGRMISLSGDDDRGKIFYDGDELTNSRMEVMLNFGVYLD